VKPAATLECQDLSESNKGQGTIIINNDTKEVLLRMFERLIDIQQKKFEPNGVSMLKRSRTVKSDEGVFGPHAVLASTVSGHRPLTEDSDQFENVTISRDGVYRITIGNQNDELSIDGEVDVVTDGEGETSFYP